MGAGDEGGGQNKDVKETELSLQILVLTRSSEDLGDSQEVTGLSPGRSVGALATVLNKGSSSKQFLI